ncbi:MAG: FadR/GntR family transcriptional regulator [Acidimicrobiales bacterium]
MPARTARPRTTPVARRMNGSGSKLAASTAVRIVDDVVARGWPVGDVLGSEPDLLERYGVSRAVFREAVRLVEHQQVARMRRGPGGGLVVTEPTVEAIIDAAVVYLHRVDARLDEVFVARLVLEEIVTDLAPDQLDEADLARVRALIADEAGGRVTDHRAFHALLASMTRNPALELFVDILNRVSTLYFSDRRALKARTVAESRHAHARIAEAVVGGDGALARRRMRKHLEAEVEFLRRRRSVRQLLPDTVLGTAASSKRAEGVARAILRDVVAGDAQPGDLLGSEAELMQRHGVSRAVLREAVRLLEHHRIASTRRGPGGGLFVATPDVGAVTDVVALYLARRGMQVGDLAELRTRLELVLVDLAVEHLDDSGVERLRGALEREREASDDEFADAGHDLHAVLASIAGNHALELVALVLIRLTRLHQIDQLSRAARRRIREDVRKTHAGIADALIYRDTELARHRMRRHLRAVATHLA